MKYKLLFTLLSSLTTGATIPVVFSHGKLNKPIKSNKPIPIQNHNKIKVSFSYFSKSAKKVVFKEYKKEFNNNNLIWKQIPLDDIIYFSSKIDIKFYHKQPIYKFYVNDIEIDVKKTNTWIHSYSLSLDEIKNNCNFRIEKYKYDANKPILEDTQTFSIFQAKVPYVIPEELDISWYAWNPQVNHIQKKYIEPYLTNSKNEPILDEQGNPKANPYFCPFIDSKTGIYSFWHCDYLVNNQETKSIYSKKHSFYYQFFDKYDNQNLPIFYKVYIIPKATKINFSNETILEKYVNDNWTKQNNSLYYSDGVYRSFYNNSFANYHKFLYIDDNDYANFVENANLVKQNHDKIDKSDLHLSFLEFMSSKFNITKNNLYSKTFNQLNSFYLDYLSNWNKIKPKYSSNLDKKVFERMKTLLEYRPLFFLEDELSPQQKQEFFDWLSIWIDPPENVNFFHQKKPKVMNQKLENGVYSFQINSIKDEYKFLYNEDQRFEYSIKSFGWTQQFRNFFSYINSEDVKHFYRFIFDNLSDKFVLLKKIKYIEYLKIENLGETYNLLIKIELKDKSIHLLKINNIKNPKYTHPLIFHLEGLAPEEIYNTCLYLNSPNSMPSFSKPHKNTNFRIKSSHNSKAYNCYFYPNDIEQTMQKALADSYFFENEIEQKVDQNSLIIPIKYKKPKYIPGTKVKFKLRLTNDEPADNEIIESLKYWEKELEIELPFYCRIAYPFPDKNSNDIELYWNQKFLKSEIENYSIADLTKQKVLKIFQDSIYKIRDSKTLESIKPSDFNRIKNSIEISDFKIEQKDPNNNEIFNLSFLIHSVFKLSNSNQVNLEIILPLYTNPLVNFNSHINLNGSANKNIILQSILDKLKNIKYESNVLYNDSYLSNSIILELGKEFNITNENWKQYIEKLLTPEYKEFVGYPIPFDVKKFISLFLQLNNSYLKKHKNDDKYKEININKLIMVFDYWKEKYKEIQISNHSLTPEIEPFDLSKLDFNNFNLTIEKNFDLDLEFINFNESQKKYNVMEFNKINYNQLTLSNKYVYFKLIKFIEKQLVEACNKLNLDFKISLFEDINFKKFTNSFFLALSKSENIINEFDIELIPTNSLFKNSIKFKFKLTFSNELKEKIDLSKIKFDNLIIDSSNIEDINFIFNSIEDKIINNIMDSILIAKEFEKNIILSFFDLPDIKNFIYSLFDINSAKRKENNIVFNELKFTIKAKNEELFIGRNYFWVKNLFNRDFDLDKIKKELKKQKQETIKSSIVVSVVFFALLASVITTITLLYRRKSKKVKAQ